MTCAHSVADFSARRLSKMHVLINSATDYKWDWKQSNLFEHFRIWSPSNLRVPYRRMYEAISKSSVPTSLNFSSFWCRTHCDEIISPAPVRLDNLSRWLETLAFCLHSRETCVTSTAMPVWGPCWSACQASLPRCGRGCRRSPHFPRINRHWSIVMIEWNIGLVGLR